MSWEGFMNRLQAAVIIVALINLALIGLFPPYDYFPPIKGGIGAFDGFSFVFADHPNHTINMSFLQIEIGVIAMNAAIAWLVGGRRGAGKPPGTRDWQTIILVVTGVNLALCLLFPPMQRIVSVTRALLSSFDGFYFVFAPHGDRAIVTQLLWLELIFIVINGALLYLLCKPSVPVVVTERDRARLAEEIRRSRG
jgi:hypothetical protein